MSEREKLIAAILNAQSREVGLPELSFEQHKQVNPHAVTRTERLLAVIEAVAPMILDEAAKVPDGVAAAASKALADPATPDRMRTQHQARWAAAVDAAAAIRAMGER
jgi:hypothetical protein